MVLNRTPHVFGSTTVYHIGIQGAANEDIAVPGEKLVGRIGHFAAG